MKIVIVLDCENEVLLLLDCVIFQREYRIRLRISRGREMEERGRTGLIAIYWRHSWMFGPAIFGNNASVLFYVTTARYGDLGEIKRWDL